MHNINETTTATSPHDSYYEHLVAYYHLPYPADSNASEVYPDLCKDYGLLGHMVVNIGQYGVLVLWSESQLGDEKCYLLEHELVPDVIVFNIERKQSLAEFQASYYQDAQTLQEYWHDWHEKLGEDE